LRVYPLILLVTFLFTSCEIADGKEPDSVTKIYSGSYGYNIAYRVVDNKVYSGSYGYDVAYRIDGNKIYSGSYGYDVAYRVDGNKIYSGSFGYNVALLAINLYVTVNKDFLVTAIKRFQGDSTTEESSVVATDR